MTTNAETSELQPYFIRESATRFRPTELTGGSWNTAEQHIAPVVGLITHLILADRDARHGENRLRMTRLSCDILGVIPIEPFEVDVRVIRPGRTIELVEATVSHGGRAAVIARAWLSKEFDTEDIAASTVAPIPPESEMPSWDPGSVWPGVFIQSVEGRRVATEPGAAQYWIRSRHPLLLGEAVSRTAQLLLVADVANGAAVLEPPTEVAFPNLDFTAHLFREPTDEWLGFDTHASFGPRGAGLTQSVLYDTTGPLGTLAQTLTVRPMQP